MMNDRLHHIEEADKKDLIKILCGDIGLEREKARKKLVRIGKEIIDDMTELLETDKHINQWEALKILAKIGDSGSIPTFLEFMESEESDLRWIAAEGMIRVGRQAVEPLLNLLKVKYDSSYIRDGAHHIFYELGKKESLPAEFPLDELLVDLKSTGKSARLKLLLYKIGNEYKF